MSHRARSKRSPTVAALAGLALGIAVLAGVPALADGRFASAVSHPAWQNRDAAEPSAPGVQGVRMADADCSAAAAEAAAQTGGQVLSVSSRSEGGRTVCVVTVLVPGEDGQRPRKRTLTLPQ